MLTEGNVLYRCRCCYCLVEPGAPPEYPSVCPLDEGGCGRTTEPTDDDEWTVFEVAYFKYDPVGNRMVFEGYL
ncbi:unnamed protein product [marine sediment metagenome]|uniref:Uncharacterized protein n=1 Tax=marine sediment metagenome TaxID=412755 RepID=X1BKM7_9ZZZZ